MSISNEHDNDSAHDSREVVQWLVIATIVLSGAVVVATWLYLHW